MVYALKHLNLFIKVMSAGEFKIGTRNECQNHPIGK